MASTGPSASRASIDKGKGMKKFMRTSADTDSRDGHKRSDSVLSENTKQTLNSYHSPNQAAYEVFNTLHLRALSKADMFQDPDSQEFDDLMRSGSTMKVSLTPDRLKTMEVRPSIFSYPQNLLKFVESGVQTREGSKGWPASIPSPIQ
jgi:hypothetical protein